MEGFFWSEKTPGESQLELLQVMIGFDICNKERLFVN